MRFVVALTGLLAFGLIALNPATAVSDASNRNLLPVGDREAFMGNAGITSASAGAVFYNPSNLTRLANATLAMTGTTLMRFELSTDALLVLGGENQPFDASGFLTIPSSIVSTYKAGSWYLGTSIIVPDAIELSNQLIFETTFARGTILSRQSQQDLWLGVSAARPVSDRVSVGVSLFGVQRSESSTQVINVVNEVGGALQSAESLDASLLGITAVVGGQWQLSDTVRIGARVQTPVLRFSGSASTYSSTLNAAGEDVTFTESSLDGVDYNDDLPWDLGAGVSVQATRGLEVVADVNVQLPDSFARLPDEAPTEYETAVRASIGVDVDLPGSLEAQFGVMFNGSALPDPEEQGEVAEDYWGVSGGLSWQSGRTRTGLGLFFQQSNGDIIPSGGTERVDTRSRLLGALVNVDYSL